MFSLFKVFQKKNNSTTNISNNSTSQTNEYNPNLIPSLLDDHKTLLNMAGSIQKSANAQKWTVVAKELNSFKEKIYGHLLIENNNLYTYLQRSLKSDAISLELMTELQKEMKAITPVIISFFKKHDDIATNIEKQSSFNEQFGAICGALAKRINCEESTLYPMYHP